MRRKFLLCLIGLLLGRHAVVQAQTGLEAQLNRIQQATVFIYQAENAQDDLFITCVASGTLVSRSGLILTNAHSTLPNAACPGDTLIIALAVDSNEPPIPVYRAEIVQADNGLDLALLQISQDLDGRRLDRNQLSLPFVEVADSSLLQLDETLTVVGYPAIDSQPLRIERATIVSFIAEPLAGEQSWIKTSISFPATMSGGAAYNRDGRLVGIPTAAPATVAEVDSCPVLQDTTRDGLINANDRCIPIGEFVNAIRPANFARPLLRGASLALNVEIPALETNPLLTPAVDPVPQITRLFFSSAVNEAGLPSTIVSSLPTGANSLYLFFDYANMTPETTYELRVSTDNIPNSTFSLAPVRWSGEVRGLWYIGATGQTLTNGIYDFTLFIDGIAKATSSIVIGGAPVETPTLSDLVFGLSDESGTPLGNGFVLPAGNVASARFIYRNMPEGVSWIARWFYEGAEVFRTPPDSWRDGVSGAKTISIQDQNGLLPGRYRLELYLDGRLAATSDFTIAGEREGAFPSVFRDIRLTAAASPQEAIALPNSNSFVTNVENIYTFFNWSQISPGTRVTIRWRVDDNLFYERHLVWSQTLQGENFLVTLTRPDGLPDGRYSIELLVDQVVLARAEASVGIGQLAIDRFAQVSGVQVGGYILDAKTGRGISGVTFLLISEAFSVEDFVWDATQLYAQATTDRNGYFQLERLLQISSEDFPVPYSVIIQADGYLPIQADGFEVTDTTANPLELTIYLMPN
ncbi:MAG: trypsin-like peptidase domain-containing protein [Phototrophicaceae bacterium]